MVNQIKITNRHDMQTDSCIIRATMLLLDKKPYDKITISDITAKAGIARRTFYRIFKSKDDILIRHLANIIDPDFIAVESINDNDNQENIYITFYMNFIRNNYSDIKKILNAVGGNIMFLNKFNELIDDLITRGEKNRNPAEQLAFKYKMYYQMTGICKIMWDWAINDMPMSNEELVKILDCFTVNTKKLYPNIPNITVKIVEH